VELQELGRRLAQAEERLDWYSSRLRQSEDELRALAYVISHDLRSPMISLRGFTAELRSAFDVIGTSYESALPHLDEQEQQRVTQAIQDDIPESLGFIEYSTRQLDELVSGILNLSRLTRYELKFTSIDTGALVQQVLEALHPQIEESDAVVTVRELPGVFADRAAMEQIWTHLLTNAVVYLDPERPGEIEVSAERGTSETSFHVRDNGCGISERDMGKVFEPFRRGGQQAVPGEGLGLAYVRTLVRRHGGRIWCVSELGGGTTFTFTISNYLTEESSHAR
jgi:signal transduction histidine kinase